MKGKLKRQGKTGETSSANGKDEPRLMGDGKAETFEKRTDDNCVACRIGRIGLCVVVCLGLNARKPRTHGQV